jgi:RimJ/RimL family protein N-acetyltransferase
MNKSLLETKNLKLVLLSATDARAMLNDMSAAERALLSADWLALLDGAAGTNPWIHGYSLVERDGGAVVGSAGFKGPPGDNGMVEIAYAVKPEYQSKGFATEAALAL